MEEKTAHHMPERNGDLADMVNDEGTTRGKSRKGYEWNSQEEEMERGNTER